MNLWDCSGITRDLWDGAGITREPREGCGIPLTPGMMLGSAGTAGNGVVIPPTIGMYWDHQGSLGWCWDHQGSLEWCWVTSSASSSLKEWNSKCPKCRMKVGFYKSASKNWSFPWLSGHGVKNGIKSGWNSHFILSSCKRIP